jgi:hypothetical protein
LYPLSFHAGDWQSVTLKGEAEVNYIRLLGRTDGWQSRSYGSKVYANDTLCGIWPAGEKNDWVEFKCPSGTKANTIKVVQEKKTCLTLCGIEVYGHYTSIDNDADTIDYTEEKLMLTWARDSGVSL